MAGDGGRLGRGWSGKVGLLRLSLDRVVYGSVGQGRAR